MAARQPAECSSPARTVQSHRRVHAAIVLSLAARRSAKLRLRHRENVNQPDDQAPPATWTVAATGRHHGNRVRRGKRQQYWMQCGPALFGSARRSAGGSAKCQPAPLTGDEITGFETLLAARVAESIERHFRLASQAMT
jgi:hypothetical protein